MKTLHLQLRVTTSTLASKAQTRDASARFTRVKSLSVDAAPFHLRPIHRTPSPKPNALAYPSQSLPRHSESGMMYPFPSYHYLHPSQAPPPLTWVGGDFSPYTLSPVPQQTYHAQGMYQAESNGAMTAANPYDPFTAAAPSLATANHAAHQPQVNPYSQDTNNMGGASYYQGQNSFAQPVRLASP